MAGFTRCGKMTQDTTKSIGSQIAEQILSFAENNQKNDLLDEVSIHAIQREDGSVVIAFEWSGKNDDSKKSQRMLDFMHDIKKVVVDSGKESLEQQPPHANIYKEVTNVGYRFRVWNQDGTYDTFERKLVTH